MTHLLLIPAVSCDGGLYSLVKNDLDRVVDSHIYVARANNMEACVTQALEQAPEKFIVLGTSFGGRVALEIALAAPERVHGLVVIGSSADGPHPSATQRITRIANGEFGAVIEEMANRVAYLPGPRGPATKEKFLAMALSLGPELLIHQTQASAGRQNRASQLKNITHPALMIWGHEDQFSSPQEGRDMAAAIPQATFHEISHCGHFPSLEGPEKFLAILLPWLQEGRLSASNVHAQSTRQERR